MQKKEIQCKFIGEWKTEMASKKQKYMRTNQVLQSTGIQSFQTKPGK